MFESITKDNFEQTLY